MNPNTVMNDPASSKTLDDCAPGAAPKAPIIAYKKYMAARLRSKVAMPPLRSSQPAEIDTLLPEDRERIRLRGRASLDDTFFSALNAIPNSSAAATGITSSAAATGITVVSDIFCVLFNLRAVKIVESRLTV